MEYVPYHELTSRPHVIADGAARRSTVLTLSHWPCSGTPWPLKADLSAETAFRFLDRPDLAGDKAASADAVSNDHLDIDGFVTVFVLARPDIARAHRRTLVETAGAGDFATTIDPMARRLAAAIAAFTRPATSPLDAEVFEQQRPIQVAALYRELIERFPSWLEDPMSVRSLWRDEDEAFDAAEAAFGEGLVEITEEPGADLDLAIVDVDPSLRLGRDFPSTLQGWGPLHPVAVHNRTDRLRVVYRSGARVGLLYRFESWVQLMTRTPAPRIDLAPLAAELNASETPGAGCEWTWAWPRNPNPPVPWLRASGKSTLTGDGAVERIVDSLRTAPLTSSDVYDPRPYGATADLAARR